MKWNWQQSDWTNFRYDSSRLDGLEAEFLHQSGVLLGTYKHIHEDDKFSLKIELISNEALKTSEIEGETLNRESLQSSLRRAFGMVTDYRKIPPAEQGISKMMVDLYKTFAEPLTHQMLFNWHESLTKGRRDLKDIGRYRTHSEPMQVVSGPVHEPKVHFEAPPSKNIHFEMKNFIRWFNESASASTSPLPALTRSGIAHLFFVSIHPFEDGNGRIGRALSEKVLSQSLCQPTLITLSNTIQTHRKDYYKKLEANNKENEITDWLTYFANTVLTAQVDSQLLIDFLIEKTKFYDRHRDEMNERQKKAVARIFQEGPKGFEGGLSAENYIRITSTSRATATRDLNDLVNKEILIRKGELKSTRYYLKTAHS